MAEPGCSNRRQNLGERPRGEETHACGKCCAEILTNCTKSPPVLGRHDSEGPELQGASELLGGAGATLWSALGTARAPLSKNTEESQARSLPCASRHRQLRHPQRRTAAIYPLGECPRLTMRPCRRSGCSGGGEAEASSADAPQRLCPRQPHPTGPGAEPGPAAAADPAHCRFESRRWADVDTPRRVPTSLLHGGHAQSEVSGHLETSHAISGQVPSTTGSLSLLTARSSFL